MERSGHGLMVTVSLAESLVVSSSPPPETPAELVSDVGDTLDTVTVNVIGG
jgi:hypothetical protein